MGRTRKAAARLVTGKPRIRLCVILTRPDGECTPTVTPTATGTSSAKQSQMFAPHRIGTELDIGTRARTKRAAFGQSDRPSRDIAAGGPRGVTGRSRAMTPRRHNRDRHSHPHGLSRNEAAALLEKAPSLPRRGLSG